MYESMSECVSVFKCTCESVSVCEHECVLGRSNVCVRGYVYDESVSVLVCVQMYVCEYVCERVHVYIRV